MAIHFSKVFIDQFRGIHGLRMEPLNHINIIAGDNNSGKTSVLESLLILRNPLSLSNLLLVASERDSTKTMNWVDFYDGFLSLFPHEDGQMMISLTVIHMEEEISVMIRGREKTVMVDTRDRKNSMYKKLQPFDDGASPLVEARAFEGKLSLTVDGSFSSVPLDFHEFSRITGMEKLKDMIRIHYLSPIDHMVNSTFDEIIRNDKYKALCINILKIFDQDIEDLFLLRHPNGLKAVEYIRHNRLGSMPLTTFGDGIKKVLSLANGIAKASGGILLIDELETSIHAKYYYDIFKFLELAAIEFDVQIFLTTHSIEAIDGLLSTQGYHEQNDQDHISVITFKKDQETQRTLSRVMTGREVMLDRENFGFEVRQ